MTVEFRQVRDSAAAALVELHRLASDRAVQVVAGYAVLIGAVVLALRWLFTGGPLR